MKTGKGNRKSEIGKREGVVRGGLTFLGFPNSGFPISDFRFPIPDFRFPISDFGFRISD